MAARRRTRNIRVRTYEIGGGGGGGEELKSPGRRGEKNLQPRGGKRERGLFAREGGEGGRGRGRGRGGANGGAKKGMYNGNGIQMVTRARESPLIERRRQFRRDLTIRAVHEAIYEVFGAIRGAGEGEGGGGGARGRVIAAAAAAAVTLRGN